MAELILNGCGTRRGSGVECRFDFEPGNEVLLEAIESFLARRSMVTDIQAGYLAGLCDESLTRKESVRRKTMLSKCVTPFLALFRGARGKTGNRAETGKKSGKGLSSGGSRSRLSFA
jgi:hypothetical protein